MGTVNQIKMDITPLGQSPREVFIYLPNSYKESKKRYPVIYMFDGQNIFFDDFATYGKSWGMKDFLDNHSKEYIVVGIDCNHTGNLRLVEYTPFEFDDSYFGYVESKGDITANWIVNKLKPYIDKKYRTLNDRENTMIGGSSMGGLMSLYCVSKHNNVFSKAACLSPSIMFIFEEMFNLIENTPMDKNTKVYMDFGSKELGGKNRTIQTLDSMLAINYLFQLKGVNTFPNIIVNGKHNEASWEKVVPIFIDYLEKVTN